MSVTIRPYPKGSGLQVDINMRLADGRPHRERKRLDITSTAAAKRWGQTRELHLLQHGPDKKKEVVPIKDVPTLAQFAPRFMTGYANANRQKASGIAAKQTIIDVHLLPQLGADRLDAITSEQVQRLKGVLGDKSAKTVCNGYHAESRGRVGRHRTDVLHDQATQGAKEVDGVSRFR